MANPRLQYAYHRIDAADVTYPADGTITVPVPGNPGFLPAISPQVGLAVASVATGTGAPKVGLGTAGGALLGKLMVVEPDGSCTIQHEGYMYLPFVTGANQPVPGGFVAVDGTGKVQKSTTFLGASCEGFGLDPEPVGAENTATSYCIVKR